MKNKLGFFSEDMICIWLKCKILITLYWSVLLNKVIAGKIINCIYNNRRN